MHTKEEIDQWLKDIGKTRQWLADQCGVKYLVVNNWFSKSRTIPKKALIIIDNLMNHPNLPTIAKSLSLILISTSRSRMINSSNSIIMRKLAA